MCSLDVVLIPRNFDAGPRDTSRIGAPSAQHLRHRHPWCLHNVWNYNIEVFAYNCSAPCGAAWHTRAVPTENYDYSRVTVFSQQYAHAWDEGENVSFCNCPWSLSSTLTALGLLTTRCLERIALPLNLGSSVICDCYLDGRGYICIVAGATIVDFDRIIGPPFDSMVLLAI